MEPATEFATLFIAQSPGGYAFHMDARAGSSRQTGFDPVGSFGVTVLDAELRRQLQQAIDVAVENLHILHATDAAGSAGSPSLAASPPHRDLRHADLINQPLERLGGLLFSILPSHLQDALSGLLDRIPLVLETNEADLPWELLHDGAAFLALRRPIGRRLLSSSLARHGAGAVATQRSFLFISNPEGNLPEADVEVQELMESFDAGAEPIEAQFVCGQQATRIEVRERMASGQYALIHYSGHARPGALLLADGELTAQEIQQSLRGQPFIFLNACQSARDGGRQKGSAVEESPYAGASARNLAAAFLLGGARGFIGSLWQIFDARSRQFAAWFYALVRDGAPVGEALRRSRAHLFPDPLWASFVLYGDPALQIVRRERREARWLSVLVVRLAGWSRLLATLTADAAASLEGRVLTALTQVAERYGGRVHTFAGDALHVHFGMPTVHANDAERAVRAAADMAQAARTLAQDAPELDACRLCLGISTGQVIGNRMRAPSGLAYRMTSQPASLAALLVSYAEDEQLLVDEHTWRRTQDAFEFAPIIWADAAPGLPKRDIPSVAVYAYRGAKRDGPSAAQIVGRDHELAQLHTWHREAKDGYGRWVGIVGAPGVGKTRLVQTFREALTSQSPSEGQRWVSAACHSYDESTTYSLLAQVIAGLADIALEDHDGVRRDKLERLLRPVIEAAPANAGARAGALEEAVALLGQVIGLRLETPSVQNLEAQARQKKLAHLFGEVLSRQARAAQALQAALVLCVDDVHWSDEASLTILNHALAVAGRAPLLCLVTFRPDWSSPLGEPAAPVGWTRLGHYRQLTLDELRPEACHALLSQRLGAPTVPETLARAVLDHTGGNPFFIEAVLRWWQDSGKLVYADETWQLEADIDGEQAPIPHTIESVIVERLDQLGEGSRAALHTAAIIGPAFERSLLDEVLDANARETLEHSLSELAQHDILEEAGGLWPDVRYVFRHSLLHQTVYNSVLEAHRRRLHRVVGHALRRRANSFDASNLSDGSEVERLAYHFFRSDDTVHAVRYCLRAARHAAGTWAHQTACDWYDRALASLDALAQALTASTNAVEPPRGVTPEQLTGWSIEAITDKGDVLVALGRNAEAVEHYRRALDLVIGIESFAAPQRADLHRRMAIAQVNQGALIAAQESLDAGLYLLEGQSSLEAGRLLVYTGLIHYRSGRLAEGLAACESAIPMIEAAGSARDLAQAYNLQGILYRNMGKPHRAQAAHQQSIALYEQVEYLPGLERATTNLGCVFQDLGRWDETLRCFQNSAELSERTGEERQRSAAQINLGEIYYLKGDLNQSIQASQRAQQLARDFGFDDFVGIASLNMGKAYLKAGELALAERHLEESRSVFERRHMHAHRPELLCHLALLGVAQGKLDDALDLAREAVNLTSASGHSWAGQAQRAWGVVQRVRGDFEDAHTHLVASQALLDEQNSPYETGLTLLDVAALRRDQSEAKGNDQALRNQACAACERAMRIFEELGASADLKRAQELRRSL